MYRVSDPSSLTPTASSSWSKWQNLIPASFLSPDGDNDQSLFLWRKKRVGHTACTACSKQVVKEFWRKVKLEGNFYGGNLMWHSSASGADEGSIVFIRLRQCAHPTNTLFLEPALVSQTEPSGISIGSAVFALPTHWSRPTSGLGAARHVSAYRSRVRSFNRTSASL